MKAPMPLTPVQHIPVSELVALPIHWVRGDDPRLQSIFRSLRVGGTINEPIRLLNCGCGKTYILEDGGHRISAAYALFRRTGRDIAIPVRKLIADFP